MVRSQLLSEVFEQSSVPQIVTAVDFSTTIENKAFYDFFGYSKEEWAVMTLKDICHPDDYEIDADLRKKLIDGLRSFYQIERRYFHKSGMLLHGMVNVSLITDPETGKKYLYMQVIDTTEKYHMNVSLKNSEEKYRLLAEHCSDMIMLHDVNGNYKYISPSYKTILGYDHSQLVGASPYDFIHHEDIPVVEKHHQQIISGKEHPPLVTYRVKKSDDTYIWVETNIKGVFNEETGELTELISVSRDIQQRIETNELLNKSERLAVVGRMAAAVAHEIRNPLTPIKGFITLLSKTKVYNPQFIDIILSKINRIELIITEFLAIAKPNKPKMSAVYIEQLVEQVVNLLQTEALMENKLITVNLEAIPTIIGDENSLKQVLLNVLRNALESMEQQGTASINVFTEAGFACIKLQDNGCGISRERLAKIGEPFYSTKEKGTGLGLMTSLNIIESHHGKMEINSEEGNGTTVNIYLPLA